MRQLQRIGPTRRLVVLVDDNHATVSQTGPRWRVPTSDIDGLDVLRNGCRHVDGLQSITAERTRKEMVDYFILAGDVVMQMQNTAAID